jgi:hypothetical protein
MCDVQYAVCGVRHSNSCSVRQCTAERTAVCVRQCGSVQQRAQQCAAVQRCGSVRLSSGAAVCGCLAVSIFSNKFKTYLYKFV